jgi:hypothetical protein
VSSGDRHFSFQRDHPSLKTDRMHPFFELTFG